MGVYIKDMTLDEFYECGDDCQTLIGIGQAEEVPPHGRLIDADAVMEDVCFDADVIWVWRVTDAPTIIEAEEKK